jgi:superfamily II DNA or RNA helicase
MSNQLVQIVHNAVHAKLVEPSRDVRLLVSEILSYKVPGAEHMPTVNWDGVSSLYEMRTNSFPAGFVRLVKSRLTRAGIKVQVRCKPAPPPLGPLNPKVDDFPDDPRYDYQMETVNRLLSLKAMIAQCATGCHAKGQRVIMYDGSLKTVESVVVNDQLMGPDSRPRQVMQLCRGRDKMYRITPLRGGRSFVVNGEHILSLMQTNLPSNRLESIYNGERHELTVNEYIGKDKTFQHIHKLHRSAGIDFKRKAPEFDPYILGLLLGDGSIKKDTPAITTDDPEVVTAMELYAEQRGMKVVCSHKARTTASTYRFSRLKGTPQRNAIRNDIEIMGLWGSGSEDKFVPDEYKYGPVETRRAILAGLIDTDGHLHNGGFDFVSKSPRLANDATYMARSLGLGVTESIKTIVEGRYAGYVYHRVSIYGETTKIPVRIARKIPDSRRQKKDVLLSGFSVEPIGEGDYYGFCLDDDQLYLLDDFTVTHNSGKSKIFKLAAERINRPTLFVTTRKTLMYQMAENYAEAIGKPIGIMGDGIWEPNPAGVNFAIVDTLTARLSKLTVEDEVEREVDAWQAKIDAKVSEYAKLKGLPTSENLMRSMPPELRKKLSAVRQIIEKRNPLNEDALEIKVKAKVVRHEKLRKQALELLKSIEFLTLEEAHEVGSDSFFLISQACVNAHYRLALTATPFMRDDQGANMRLMAATGPIGIVVSEETLIDRGILATPYFKFIVSKAPAGIVRGTKYQTAYAKGIVDNAWRNHQVVTEVQNLKLYGLTAMILVQQTKHGKNLEKMLRNVGLKARFISGESNQDKRAEALDDLSNNRLDVLIGSTILDVGVDVPSVGAVFLAGGGKAEVAIRQRIGRGLRAKKNGPNVCFVYDFEDQGNNHLVRHSKERRRIIEETKGFGERIVKHFEFEKLGFKAVA